MRTESISQHSSRRTLGRAICLTAALGLSRPVTGGTNIWTSSGPAGVSIGALAIAINPQNPSTVYAGSGAGGVFKSIDGASTWFPASRGLAERSVLALAIDPTRTASLFAGTDAGVFTSDNGGTSWILSGAPAIRFRAVVIDPQTPSTIYAGGSALYKSVDRGANWIAMGSGLPANPSIFSLAIDPVNPSILYAGASGLYKSVDGGAHWINRSSGPLVGALVNNIVIDPSNPSTVYAAADGLTQGICKSTNGGDSWTFSAVGASFSIVINPTAPSTLYAATGLGVLKTVDGGGHWAPGDSGITKPVITIAIEPILSSTLYAAGDGIFKTVDSAVNWTSSAEGLTNSVIFSTLVDPFDSQRLYACAGRDGIARSLDGGASWEPPISLGSAIPLALAANPLLQGTLYCGTQNLGSFKSVDAGAHWSPAGSVSQVFKLAFDRGQPPTLYAGTVNGLYVSTDRAATWTTLGTIRQEIRAVAISQANGNVIYVGTYEAGVFKSFDGGQTWIAANSGLTSSAVLDLAIDPGSPSTLFAATPGAGVFKTTNGGVTWTSSNAGLISLDVRAIVLDPVTASTVFAATAAGVFQSIDGGASWVLFGVGLENRNALTLAIDATGRGLHAGTQGRGVFDYRIAGAGFYTVSPCRLVDTRNPDGPYGGPALEAGADRSFTLAGQCGIPAGARSLALNVTVTDPTTGPGHLTFFAGDRSPPQIWTINYSARQTRSGNAIVTLDGSGEIQVRCDQGSGTAHLVIDVSGYFQ